MKYLTGLPRCKYVALNGVKQFAKKLRFASHVKLMLREVIRQKIELDVRRQNAVESRLRFAFLLYFGGISVVGWLVVGW